jgi:HK97 family phage major capsid protein
LCVAIAGDNDLPKRKNMDKPLDRSSADYAEIYRTYLRRGARGLTDVEARALSISSGGTALAPTDWSKFIDAAIDEDFILNRVRKVATTTAFKLPIYNEDMTVNTNVAEAGLGTESSPTYSLPRQGTTTGTGGTFYTFSLKKITAWTKVSNELLADSKASSDVEKFLRQELVAGLVNTVNSQILIGGGTTQCQGAFTSAKAYGRTVSTTGTTAITPKDIISSVWGSTTSALSPMAYESWINSVAVVNSRLVGNFDATFYPVLFPSFRGYMNSTTGTTVEGLPTVYHRLSTGSPQAGDTAVMFFDPSKYLLAHSFDAFSVARFDERYADSNETLFVGSIRADGSITNTSAVLNVNRS